MQQFVVLFGLVQYKALKTAKAICSLKEKSFVSIDDVNQAVSLVMIQKAKRIPEIKKSILICFVRLEFFFKFMGQTRFLEFLLSLKRQRCISASLGQFSGAEFFVVGLSGARVRIASAVKSFGSLLGVTGSCLM